MSPATAATATAAEQAASVRVTLPAQALKDALARVDYVGKSTHVAVSSHTLIEPMGLGGGSLRLTTTDLNQWARTMVECDAPEGGEGPGLCAPSDVLGGLVRSFPRGDVALELDGPGQMLRIDAGGEYELQCLAADEFPPMPEPKDAATWTMPAAKLAEALGFVAWARSTDNARPVMWGSLIDMERGWVAGCDGHNLAIHPVAEPNEGAQEGAPRVNVPGDGLRNLLAKTEGDVTLRADGRTLAVETGGGFEYVARLIEGDYPRIENVVPRDDQLTFRAEANRAALREAVVRAKLYVGRDLYSTVRLTWRDGELTASARQADKGRTKDAIPTDIVVGTDYEILFNAGYLDTALKDLDADTVLFRGQAPERAALWSTPDDPSRFYQIMPKRDLDKR